MPDPAPKWSKEIRACKTTWLTLLGLDQIQSAFPQAGDIKMNEMTFWSAGGGADLRATRAETLLNQIDNTFRIIRGAKFEEGTNENDAKAALRGVLLDSEQTVADLAAAANTHYLFLGETSNET